MMHKVEDTHLEHYVVVSRIVTESDGVVSLTLAAADGSMLPAWHSGAHIDLVLPTPQGELIRQYSLCGARDVATWRVAVLREQAGRGGSAWIHDSLREGDHLHARGPRNNFPLVDQPSYLFIAGGIGVTPMMAMLRSANSVHRPWRFLYGGRTRASMAFVDEVLAYGEGVLIWPEDTHGLLPLREEIAKVDADTAVYCCGPEPLINAVEKVCADLGRAAPLVERFAPKEQVDDGEDRPFTVVLQSTGDRYLVPVGESIVEVLEDNGVAVSSSCQEGVCGTCETRIVSGSVAHRDSLLSDEEKVENEYMMICVSRATSDELVLDM